MTWTYGIEDSPARTLPRSLAAFSRLFLQDDAGRRPVNGGNAKQDHPHFRLIMLAAGVMLVYVAYAISTP
jgi:hypothetical protein